MDPGTANMFVDSCDWQKNLGYSTVLCAITRFFFIKLDSVICYLMIYFVCVGGGGEGWWCMTSVPTVRRQRKSHVKKSYFFNKLQKRSICDLAYIVPINAKSRLVCCDSLYNTKSLGRFAVFNRCPSKLYGNDRRH